MKILTFFTGGTIGSSANEGYIYTDNSTKEKLLYMYRQAFPKKTDIEFETQNPFTLHSENLNGSHIAMLISYLSKINLLDYDGIIITHGTDTIQYTSAALGYYFSSLTIPIVIVSSNYILDDPRANGLDNFTCAVELIELKCYTGVYVTYENSDGICYVHHGTRLLPQLPYEDDLRSLLSRYALRMCYRMSEINNCYESNSSDDYTTDKEYDYEHEDKIEAADFSNEAYNSTIYKDKRNDDFISHKYNNFRFSCPPAMEELSSILMINAYPGQVYPNLNPDTTKAVLLSSYHSGTLNTSNEELAVFTNEAFLKRIPVFLTGGREIDLYESVKHYESLRIKVLPTSSPIAMYIKMWLYISCVHTGKYIDAVDMYEFLCSTLGNDIL